MDQEVAAPHRGSHTTHAAATGDALPASIGKGEAERATETNGLSCWLEGQAGITAAERRARGWHLSVEGTRVTTTS